MSKLSNSGAPVNQICSICGQVQQISTRNSEKRFSIIISTSCGCGFNVEIVPKLNLVSCISSDPLPGYDRQSVEAALTAAGVLYVY